MTITHPGASSAQALLRATRRQRSLGICMSNMPWAQPLAGAGLRIAIQIKRAWVPSWANRGDACGYTFSLVVPAMRMTYLSSVQHHDPGAPPCPALPCPAEPQHTALPGPSCTDTRPATALAKNTNSCRCNWHVWEKLKHDMNFTFAEAVLSLRNTGCTQTAPPSRSELNRVTQESITDTHAHIYTLTHTQVCTLHTSTRYLVRRRVTSRVQPHLLLRVTWADQHPPHIPLLES